MDRAILIVDDSLMERTILYQMLHKDYTILEAKNGEEAIRIISENFNKISAVIMDVVMPGMSGFETLTKIRANHDWKQLPIIIATGLDDDESREKAIINGADNFITKPYNRALLIYTVQNVIRLREASEIANSLSRDNLTGLLNRDSFFNESKRMIRRHEPGYYIMSCFDVDNFKVINDQYGADIGDKVLRHIADCLRGFVAGINGLTCRYTADKFAILYPASMKDSSNVFENHKKTTMPECITGTIRIRIGRYLVDDLSIAVSTMFDRAALAQESIKDRYDVYIADYTESMREHMINEQRIVNNMKNALKNGEFEPWFQPQYNHMTGALIGAEALARWKKDGKIIPPTEFIHVFERNGFIYEMDKNIWEQVCILMRRWIDEGKNPLPVSINISRRDLQHLHFISVLTGIVDKYHLPYELIRLEVTESAFADSSIVKRVDELISIGFTVEIDDFGSGYSSLNTLKDVPASILKLDMKFFEDTNNTQRSGNIIESVVRMAKWLGMSIIAEGVEEKYQADYLKSIGCYYIQGYFYAKPMMTEEYEKLLDFDRKEPKLSALKTIDTLDNNEFWNPKSIETLIFNSYVGGACIFEYCNGKSELIRMNEQYIRELGGLIPSETQIINANIFKFLSPSERNKAISIIQRSIETNKEATCEVCLSDGKQTEYIRITNRVIARAGDRYMFYGVVLNVSEQRRAEIKEHNMAVQLGAILNNMMGAVSASEFGEDGRVELLFANKRFYEMYGYTEEQYKAEVRNMVDIIHPDDREKTVRIAKSITEECGTATYEFRCYKRDGSMIWQRINNSVVKLEGFDKPVLIAVSNDITADRKANEQLGFLNEAAHDMRLTSDSNVAINDILTKILIYFNSERTYVMEDDSTGDLISNTYEVCADKIQSIKFKRQNIPAGMSGRRNENNIIIRDVSCASDYRPEFLNMLSEQGIKSTIIVPLIRDGVVFGTIGIDNPRTSWDQIDRLKALGDYITILIINRDEKIKIDDAQKQISSLMDKTNKSEYYGSLNKLLDNIPCGVALYDYDENNIKAIHINKGYWKLLGRKPIEDSKVSIYDAVHPEDKDVIEKEIKYAIRMNRELHSDIRIMRGDGKYSLFHISAYIQPNGDGKYTLFVSHIPITEQTKLLHEMDFELSTLLYTIPSGVFKYSADEKEEFEYISRNFIESLGYTEESFKEKFHNCFREMIYEEDREMAEHEIIVQEGNGGIGKFDYRIEAADGMLHWFHDEGVKVIDEQGREWYYVTLVDVTEQKETEKNLRLAEEEYRVAIRHSGHTIGRYSIAEHTLSITEDAENRLAFPELIHDVPYGRVKLGKISPETADAYIKFYEDIISGKKEGTVTFCKLFPNGWRWVTEHSTTIFDEKGKPISAIISYKDVTEHQEKEIAFKKWQQELENKKTDTFTLYRINLNKNSTFDSVDGTLLDFVTDNDTTVPLNERTKDFAMQCVVEEDRERYIDFVNADTMLASYYRGKRTDTIEFRARISNSKVHWLRLTVDLVEYPNSSDVEAYLMYDDINDSKVVELITKEQAETDPLTGLLNRKAFAERLNEIINCKSKGGYTALFLIDMDGFKLVNDNFGHSVGDQVLIDAGKAIRSIVYGGDLVCRIGGDEFIVCVRNMPDRDMILKKAKQICALTRRSFSFGVQLTISLGISVFPDDGDCFDTLYQKADRALYRIKDSGKNNCIFYSEDMENDQIYLNSDIARNMFGEKQRMLIVDDNEGNRLYLEAIFESEFIVDCVNDGESALIYLKQHEKEVSIVLLDLMMPEVSGFDVLDKMNESAETHIIPVIIVSGIDDRETNLRAFRHGAYDFISKPVDADLIRIRVRSAIERSETKYFRMQNEFLSIQRDEIEKIRRILEDDGTVIVEYEKDGEVFKYDQTISNVLSGTFDGRPLWNVFDSDNISSRDDAQRLKSLIYDLIDNEDKKSENTVMKLKTKSGIFHDFRVKVMRCDSEIMSENKVLLTFTDIESLTK